MTVKFTPVVSTSEGYFLRATWQARHETPEALAQRFLRQIDRLAAFDPLFELWTCGANRPTKFETMRDRYADEIAAGQSKDDWGEPVEVRGYGFGAMTRGKPDTRSYAFRITAGAHIEKQAYQNEVILSTFSMTKPDPEAVTYRIFREAILSLVDAWDPFEASARPDELMKHAATRGLFEEPWMQYLAAPLASLVTPPASATVERLSDGGLLISATTDTFRVDDPQHLEVAHEIARAIAPLNETPYAKRR